MYVKIINDLKTRVKHTNFKISQDEAVTTTKPSPFPQQWMQTQQATLPLP
jgi:hypothetical protein